MGGPYIIEGVPSKDIIGPQSLPLSLLLYGYEVNALDSSHTTHSCHVVLPHHWLKTIGSSDHGLKFQM